MSHQGKGGITTSGAQIGKGGGGEYGIPPYPFHRSPMHKDSQKGNFVEVHSKLHHEIMSHTNPQGNHQWDRNQKGGTSRRDGEPTKKNTREEESGQ